MSDDQPARQRRRCALFGDGMSSPLIDEIRERRGLVYYPPARPTSWRPAGQFVIEASTAPDKLDELLRETHRLLQAQARRIGAVDLERASNQIAVRRMRRRNARCARSRTRRWTCFVRPRALARRTARKVDEVSAAQVQATFARMLAAREAVAIAGTIRKGTLERARAIFGRG